jgi:osmoprotectant transport system permease protein
MANVLISQSTFELVKDFADCGPPVQVYLKGKADSVYIREVKGIPSLGTIVLAFLIVTRSGRNAAILGLVAYSFLPVLRGTMVGLQQVSRDVVKAATGMGMSKLQVLRSIELPLSVPVVLTGVRTSLVLTVSSAPLAAFIGGGTLGGLITSGFAMTRPTLIFTGSGLAAGLALLADWAGGIVEDVLRPRGL